MSLMSSLEYSKLIKIMEKVSQTQKEYEELKTLSKAILIKKMMKFNELCDLYDELTSLIGEDRLKEMGLPLKCDDNLKIDIEEELKKL